MGIQCEVTVHTTLQRWVRRAAWAVGAALLAACGNNPWPAGSAESNTLFSTVWENMPRHLDPTASYWSNDTYVTYQVYEPLYGYHLLKRPYTLIPKAAAEVVKPHYVDAQGKALPDDAPPEAIAESIYDIPIKKGILYAPHPAFARDAKGNYLYHHLKPGELGARRIPSDFEHQGTREVVAEDFVYAFKRHATTRITAPISYVFSEFVIGLADYMKLIKKEDAKLQAGIAKANPDKPFLDFRRWPLAGVTAPEKHLLRIRLKGKYPQWKYWLATTFASPVPWEADAFYANPGLAAAGTTLDTYPVGSGPFMLTLFDKTGRIEMLRNPNYRGEPYPCEGTEEDKAAGLLKDCGQKTPFVDKLVGQLERERTPRQNKFRDGYTDLEVFERNDTGSIYVVEAKDSPEARAKLAARGHLFKQTVDVNSYFIAFNMLDPTIGKGDTPEQQAANRKLRQAIAIALNWEEYSQVFPDRAGQTAQGLIPPGIFGSREGTLEGVNPMTHRVVDGQIVRRPLEDAKRLMIEAGYPGGRSAKTGKPLVLNYDVYTPATPERKPEMDWVVKQFGKLGIQMEIRATDNNQFQDKVRKNKHQVYWLGWNADYPDAENFFFIFYGPNSKSLSDGENTSNYQSAEFDKKFLELKTLDEGPRKQALIDELNNILREDAPLTMGFFPYSSVAIQPWVSNSKPSIMIRDHGRYLKLDTQKRAELLGEWNRPIYWPLAAMALAVALLVWLARATLARRERSNARGEVLA